MTVSINVGQAVVNAGLQGGNQTNARTVALADGGFVVVWQDPFGSTPRVMMQRYDGTGAATGPALVALSNATLQDVAVNGAGSVVVAASNGTALSMAYFSGTNLSLTTIASQTFGDFINSAQIDASVSPAMRIMLTEAGGALRTAVSTEGSIVFSGNTLLATLTAGTKVLESVATEIGAGTDRALLNNGQIFDSSGFNKLDPGQLQAATDFLQVEPGFYVAMTGFTSSSQPRLVGLFGQSVNANALLVDSNVAGGFSPGGEDNTAFLGAREMVYLGDGRILLVWAANKGNGSLAVNTGIYSCVYNTLTGQPEATAILLRNISLDPSSVTINATELADGRVAIAYSAINGLAGTDAFRVIVDARVKGVIVSASSEADSYVGSAFDDSFLLVNTNDTIVGGGGNDTVALAGNAIRLIDLDDAGAFPGGGPKLTGIENLTTGSGADALFGTAGVNVLNGGAGNDWIDGRGGNDNLIGSNGDDTMIGGDGLDTIDGGTNNDLILGGLADDVLFGGTGQDTLRGDAGFDLLQGGDDNDVLTGGEGDDTLYGGLGNDTINAGGGADLVFGGDGDDIVFMGPGILSVDGGAGSDTASFGRVLIDPVIEAGVTIPRGVYADLTGLFDPLAATLGYSPEGTLLSGIENLTGSRADDFLAGDAQGNRLNGGAGADVLLGRGGTDTLVGGAGADQFVFDTATAANDRIRDFAVGEDRMVLLLDAFGDIDAGNIGTRFVANATATVGASGEAQLVFDNGGAGAGRLFFDADGNGAGVAILVATIQFSQGSGVGAFSSADFSFI